MPALRRFFALVAVLLAIAAAPAWAEPVFPKFTGLVVDGANVLPPAARIELTRKLEALQKDTQRQLVVVTVNDTQGYPLQDYANRLLRAWGVGLKGVDNGAILLIAPGNPAGQRGPRIEVGYGLEPILTDALSSVIINQRMLPLIRAGQLPQAIVAGTDAVIEQLRASPDEARAKTDAAIAAFDKAQKRGTKGSDGLPLGLIFWGMILIFVVLSFARRGQGRRYGGGGGGSGLGSVVLWSIASELGREASRGGWGGGGDWGGGSDGGGWGGGGFTGGGGGSGGGGGASGSW